jgi:protein gp37
MATRTGINWTDSTWNPTTGCDRVSPGCDNCYALTQAARMKAMGSPAYQLDGDPRTSGPGFALTLHPDRLDLPRRWANSRFIFVNSMSDLFHESVPDEFIAEVFAVMADTPRHTYQVLTKRSRRIARSADSFTWPTNLWMGISLESARYRFRIDHLREVPSAKRFISAEPLLAATGPLDLTGIDWLIAGGESGPGARPLQTQWLRDIRDGCLAQGTDFWFKQWGAWIESPEGTRRWTKDDGAYLDGVEWHQRPALGAATA